MDFFAFTDRVFGEVWRTFSTLFQFTDPVTAGLAASRSQRRESSFLDVLGYREDNDTPETRARRLLWSLLSERQKRQFQQTGMFLVKTNMGDAILGDGKIYWAARGVSQNCWPARNSAPGNRDNENMPVLDTVIAQLFNIRTDGEKLYRIGCYNRHDTADFHTLFRDIRAIE